MNNINKFIKKTADDATKYFQEIGYPSTKDENWRFTDISDISLKKFSSSRKQKINKGFLSKYLIDDCYHIISINGYLDFSISDKLPFGIELMKISDTHIDIESSFSKIATYKGNAFNAINTSEFREGILLSISLEKIDKPIQILNFFSAADKKQVHYPRLLVLTNNGSSCSLINHFIFEDDKSHHLVNSVVEIELLKNSEMNYSVIQQGSNKSNILESTAINQSSHSRLNYCSFTLDGKFTRNDIEINLKDICSEVNLQGLFLGKERKIVDYHSIINHASPNCTSNEKFHGIMNDKSRGIFNGLINVFIDAVNTNSNQINRNLLLSNSSTINSNPQLEIFCDNVSCTHGSTTGYLDEEMIFYLRSRGISKSKAKQMLIYGFAKEIIDTTNHDPIKYFLYDYINNWIN